jgi:hypothetical protein
VTQDELERTLKQLYPSGQWPKPFGLLGAAAHIAAGVPLSQVARDCGTTKKRVTEFLAAPDPLVALFGSAMPSERAAKGARQMLGNLIVGRCAERIFVERYRKEAAVTELTLSDLRESRSDTDYRLLNGRGRPVYRVNIKFVGSQFRRSKELVGLEPADCFALATYKIKAALQKQEEDKLPFLFIVVSVPGLSADDVGGKAASDWREFLALVVQGQGIPKKKAIEDRVVDHLEEGADPGFVEVQGRIEDGNWYVLSARRADKLLRAMLYDRIYALKVKSFVRQFPRAEVDMHFSFAQDLTPLDTYLHTLRESGYPMVTTLLERGEY